LILEPLEERTLLAAALLDINNTTGSPTKGQLSYLGSANVTNNLTVKTSTVVLDPTLGSTELVYTFTDKAEPINLGPGAVLDGWTGSGTNTVTGPGSIKNVSGSVATTTSYVSSVAINLQNGSDTVAIASVSGATSLTFNNAPGDADTVTIGGAGGAQGIGGNVTIVNHAGTTALTVNDSGDTKPETAFVSNGVLSNLFPAELLFGAANLSSLSIVGANALGTLNVNANAQGPVAVAAGATTGSGTITVGTNPPINYANFLAVNVSNAADQPLTQVSQTITTTTGDVPTEGKSFTYLTTTFADADPQAKSSSFTATINWGDGPSSVAGAISSDGTGRFQVSGMHTYQKAGSYPVVTMITDLGTTDTLSLAGIAVTISDVGGSGLTTGSVAQANLAANSVSIPAQRTDPNLINPWGITQDTSGLTWVADEGAGVATVEGPGASTAPATLIVIPPASGQGTGAPTGIVSNTTSDFAIANQPSTLLFATLDGTISGWNGQPGNGGPHSAVIALNNAAAGAVYTGLAIANDGTRNLLYVANFQSGKIEVYDGQFQPVNQFTDPNLPAGYAPYNIENLGGQLYVTFAKRGIPPTMTAAQLGAAFVDVFTPTGSLVQRLITGAPLDAPWGLALAPAAFGQFSNDLLVANHGNGQVDAFNPTTGQFLGVFADATGAPIVNGGLYGLSFSAGNTLDFTAGINGGAGGLVGTLTPTPDSVAIGPATLSASVSNLTAFVDQPFNGVVGTFTDANIYAVAGDFTATVQWGDGTSDTSGDGSLTITQSAGPGSSFLIMGTHIYTTATTGSPPDIVKINIAENDGASSVFAQGTASISQPTLHASFSSFSAFVGVPYTGPVATFTDDAPDPHLNDYAVTINWGDGTTTPGAIALANGAGQGFIVTDAGAHIYKSATTGQAPYVVALL
jgi:uncharacterized protein (TIGR03118 family)